MNSASSASPTSSASPAYRAADRGPVPPRAELLRQYEAGSVALADAALGLPDPLAAAHPVPGTWSIQEIGAHLADCEQMFAVRMKWVLSEDNPTLPGFDENAWMTHLTPTTRPLAESVAMVWLIRQEMSRILHAAPDAAFSRFGTHSERGRLTLGDIIHLANWHLGHHLRFARDKRAMLEGRPAAPASKG